MANLCILPGETRPDGEKWCYHNGPHSFAPPAGIGVDVIGMDGYTVTWAVTGLRTTEHLSSMAHVSRLLPWLGSELREALKSHFNNGGGPLRLIPYWNAVVEAARKAGV